LRSFEIKGFSGICAGELILFSKKRGSKEEGDLGLDGWCYSDSGINEIPEPERD
jgi:hypothetical protein